MQTRLIKSLDELEDLADVNQLKGFFDVPAELYHRGPGIGSSGLKALLRSPAHYEAYRQDPPDSKAMRAGRLVHTLVLEPKKFLTEYFVADCAARNANAFKSAEILNPDKVCVTRKEREEAVAIAKAIPKNELATQALLSEGGHNELSVYWDDPETGILCRARADRLYNGVIFDLKTTGDAQARAFSRSIADYAYHLSAAFYADGFATVLGGKPEFSWIAVEKVAPHGIAFYAASDETLAIGRAEYAQALRVYQDYLKRDPTLPLPGYPQRFEMIDLPAYYKPRCTEPLQSEPRRNGSQRAEMAI